jgi:hypothetical protein
MGQLSHMRIVYVYQVNFVGVFIPVVLQTIKGAALSVVEPVANIVKRNRHHTIHAKPLQLQLLFQ